MRRRDSADTLPKAGVKLKTFEAGSDERPRLDDVRYRAGPYPRWTGIRRGLAFSAFGSVNVRTPCWRFALMPS